jgi:hypothetical protein
MERMKQPGEEKNMYSIEFYEKENGESDVWDFLEELREKAATNKDARIQYRQITLYIELLQNNGTRQPDNITKHIEENIWASGEQSCVLFLLREQHLCPASSFPKKDAEDTAERN